MMYWDEEDLNQQRVQKMIAEVTQGAGVLVTEDTGFTKQGTVSVGVGLGVHPRDTVQMRGQGIAE
jgi:SRSO17 transposase